MGRSRKLMITGAVALALGAGGVAFAQPTEHGSDSGAGGADAKQARLAAIELVRGGEVIGVERGDDGRAAWVVEIIPREQRLEPGSRTAGR